MGSHSMGGDAPDSDAVMQILNAFRQITHLLRVAASAAHAQAGVSAAQLFVLHKLEAQPGASLNELAALTHTHQSSVSVVVAKLVERGLIDRMPAEADRRRLELRLSPAGRALLRRAPDPTQDELIAAIGRLAPTQRRQLSRTLTALTGTLTPPDAAPAMFFEEATTKTTATKRAKRRPTAARKVRTHGNA